MKLSGTLWGSSTSSKISCYCLVGLVFLLPSKGFTSFGLSLSLHKPGFNVGLKLILWTFGICCFLTFIEKKEYSNIFVFRIKFITLGSAPWDPDLPHSLGMEAVRYLRRASSPYLDHSFSVIIKYRGLAFFPLSLSYNKTPPSTFYKLIEKTCVKEAGSRVVTFLCYQSLIDAFFVFGNIKITLFFEVLYTWHANISGVPYMTKLRERTCMQVPWEQPWCFPCHFLELTCANSNFKCLLSLEPTHLQSPLLHLENYLYLLINPITPVSTVGILASYPLTFSSKISLSFFLSILSSIINNRGPMIVYWFLIVDFLYLIHPIDASLHSIINLGVSTCAYPLLIQDPPEVAALVQVGHGTKLWYTIGGHGSFFKIKKNKKIWYHTWLSECFFFFPI
ncbi:hypothetical protein VP01_3370g3 [Puccinia sorghi]|uniref:Uncharacterized protein n=1 Tax=Puccinia sorghi TaxID=27349 RepID=A0A0L6UXR2_9BASI|nr:hypothetical protein VP01_3370g3 [Puccinia sorghi]